MSVQMEAAERDYRLEIINSLLSTPHRDEELMARLAVFHTNIRDKDPLFYGPLASWYMPRGEVRDHKVAFTGTLFTSIAEHREAAFAFLMDMEPYMVPRVYFFMKDHLKKRTNPARDACVTYLRELERDEKRFDGAIQSRSDLKALYVALKLKPSPRARDILFLDKYPERTTWWAVRKIAGSRDPEEQAQLLIDYKIPAKVASDCAPVSLPFMFAWVDRMKPAEVLNHYEALKKRGAMDNADLKAIIDRKLAEAKTHGRVSSLKAAQVARRQTNEEDRRKLAEVSDARVKQGRRIRHATGLMIDASSSLNVAIESGKQVGAYIAALMGAEFYEIVFNEMPYEIKVKGTGLSDQEEALAHVQAVGATSIGAGFAWFTRGRKLVEQFVIVTDGQETRPPWSYEAYADYVRQMGVKPKVVVVQVGNYAATHGPSLTYYAFEQNMKKTEAEVVAWDLRGQDYYSLPNLGMILAASTKLDLLMEIMETPLPAYGGRKFRHHPNRSSRLRRAATTGN